MKYKQKYTPIAKDSLFKDKKLGELKEFIKDYFNKNLRGKSVKNLHKGVTVKISRTGLNHLLYARNIGYVKIKAVVVLDKMLKHAEYTNFKEKDENDSKDILGYLNFKCKVKIENKIQLFRLVVRLTTAGNFYYDHAVKIKQ